MMKNIFSLALALVLLLSLFCACASGSGDGTTAAATQPTVEDKDYSTEVKLELSSAFKKHEVTVKTYVDGDTTHFNIPDSEIPGGVLKARYLAVNTPESTGKIEEWGKKASNYTKERLMSADKIYVESEDANWNPDSTGSRYLVWVWYKLSGEDFYRNLNIELLQNGLAIASSSANNRYGQYCTAAIELAKAKKLNIYSGEKDPDFYYGDSVELTLKELRSNVSAYNGIKVAFEGVITMNNDNTVYVEEFDPETGTYFGMAVYYGFGLSGEGLDILSVGNRSRIVGTVQYYEAGDSWQVSGLTYRIMKPNDPSNIQLISKGNSAAFLPVTPEEFNTGKVKLTNSTGDVEMDFAAASVNTSVSMDNLYVKSIFTTTSETSSQKGAMTMTCECGDQKITVRTNVLYDADGKLVTEDAFKGKTISVKGIIDKYDGSYQIRVLSLNNIIIK